MLGQFQNHKQKNEHQPILHTYTKINLNESQYKYKYNCVNILTDNRRKSLGLKAW
jgi:hypothetical protein